MSPLRSTVAIASGAEARGQLAPERPQLGAGLVGQLLEGAHVVAATTIR